MNGFMTPGPFKSTLYLGMVVNVSLTGSHTDASYPTKVVYINQTSTIIHLLGTTSLGDANFTTARAYRWKATLTLSNLSPIYLRLFGIFCSSYTTLAVNSKHSEIDFKALESGIKSFLSFSNILLIILFLLNLIFFVNILSRKSFGSAHSS